MAADELIIRLGDGVSKPAYGGAPPAGHGLRCWLDTGNASSSGTETLTAVISGAAAANFLNSNSNNPAVFPSLVFSGPVDTSTSNVTLGNSKKAKATHTFVTPVGNFVVTRGAKSKAQAQPSVTSQSGNTCYFKQNGGGGKYKVDGSKSTGKFAGATGSGTFATMFVYATDLSRARRLALQTTLATLCHVYVHHL